MSDLAFVAFSLACGVLATWRWWHPICPRVAHTLKTNLPRTETTGPTPGGGLRPAPGPEGGGHANGRREGCSRGGGAHRGGAADRDRRRPELRVSGARAESTAAAEGRGRVSRVGDPAVRSESGCDGAPRSDRAAAPGPDGAWCWPWGGGRRGRRGHRGRRGQGGGHRSRLRCPDRRDEAQGSAASGHAAAAGGSAGSGPGHRGLQPGERGLPRGPRLHGQVVIRRRSMFLRIILSITVVLGLGLAPAPAPAAPLDGSVPMLCAVTEAHDCVAKGGCEWNPVSQGDTFWRVNLQQQVVSSLDGARTSPIGNVQRENGLLLLQGVQNARV